MRLRAGSALVLLSALSGCSLFTEPNETDRLTAARRQWLITGTGYYTYEIRYSCECMIAGRWIEITVLGGQVEGGRYVDTGQPLDPYTTAGLPKINDLFDAVDRALAQRAVMLEVDYAANDGHPTRIFVDPNRRTVDDEYEIRTRNLQGLFISEGSPSSR